MIRLDLSASPESKGRSQFVRMKIRLSPNFEGQFANKVPTSQKASSHLQSECPPNLSMNVESIFSRNPLNESYKAGPTDQKQTRDTKLFDLLHLFGARGSDVLKTVNMTELMAVLRIFLKIISSRLRHSAS